MDARAPAFGYPAPWGYVATVAWAVVALLISTAATYFCYVIWYGGDMDRAVTGSYDGVLVTISALASAPAQIAILIIAAYLKEWPIAQYLGLLPARAREALFAVAILLVIMAATELTLISLGQDVVPEFQRDAYRSAKAAGWLPGLLLGVVVFAPVAEEIMFRGFMYRGFVKKPGHEPYAIVILTLAFMALHVQYDWVGLVQVFVMGLYLGWVRWTTGSTLLTIVLHVLVNLEAMTLTMIKIEWASL